MAARHKSMQERESVVPHQSQGWAGQARMGLGWAVFTGRVGDAAPHRHHAVQIALAHSKPLRIWTVQTGWIHTPGIVMGADVQHRLAESELPVTLIYLEGESDTVRAVPKLARSSVELLSRKVTSKLLSGIEGPGSNEVATRVASTLGADSANRNDPATIDPVIRASLASLPRPLPARITLAQLAQGAGLSHSRYAHRFVAHTGMALRPFLRWLRLITAVEVVMRGARLTDAAHAAGFADSAHFSRTFRQHFGVAPRLLLELMPPETRSK